MTRVISKLLLSSFATLLVFAAVVSIPAVSYSKEMVPAETISLENGWSACDAKGNKIADAFTFFFVLMR